MNDPGPAGRFGLAAEPAPDDGADLQERCRRAARIASFEICFEGAAAVRLGPDWAALFGPPAAGGDGGWLALIHEGDRARVEQCLREHAARGSTWFAIECRVPRANGAPALVELRAGLAYDQAGRLVRLSGVAVELSSHGRTNGALEARNLRHEILAEAAARLISGDDPDATVAELFQILAGRVGLDVCFNYLACEHEGALKLDSQVGLSPQEAQTLATLPIGQAVCGMVAQSRHWAYVPEVQACDEPRTALIRSMGIGAYASFPLEAGHELLGTLSFGTRQRTHFDEEELAFFRTISHHVAAMKQRRRVERERELLAAELSHRVRNVFAVVQALATQTDARAMSAEQYQDVLMGRLRAQTRAHGLLLDAHGQRADLRGLLEEILDAYRFERPDVIECEGPVVHLDARQTMSLSLILHELGTNAAKYGALAAPGGRVRVTWSERATAGKHLIRLTWTEENGPPVTPPPRKGFGTRLIEQAAEHELNGRAELVYRPGGLRCVIEFPLG